MAEMMQIDELNILNLQDDILMKMCLQLNETDLLNTTKVCKKLNTIARDAFGAKYNGDSEHKYYEVIVYSDDRTQEPKPYWPFFNTFGDKMTALKLNLHLNCMHCSKIVRNHWLIRIIEKKCNALTKLKITLNGEEAPISVTGLIPILSQLTHLSLHKIRMKNSKWALNPYPLLVSFNAYRVKGFQPLALNDFFIKNPQLQHISMAWCDGVDLNVLETLHNTAIELKSLDLITFDGTFSSHVETIKIGNLESLKISVGHSTLIGILRAIANGCENLQHLEVTPVKMDYKCQIRGDAIDVICSFKQLKRLDVR